MTLSAGTKLGPYEVISPLGAGGMGEVYKAKDTRLGREVAIKVLPGSLANDSDALARFEREARAIAALNHPNILSIFDFGNDAGVAYAAMELLDGETLREVLSRGALPVRKAADYAVQMAHGIAAAHEKGIIHRDLKPENIFVTGDGRVKILDFGLAKASLGPGEISETNSPTVSAYTQPGTVMGTVGYMSPEQVRGKPADARSDIFSFGVVLYEMLTGRRAFKGESAAETMAAIAQAEPPAISLAMKSIPTSLDRIVQRCLEKNSGQRFQSARDLAFALSEAAQSGGSATGAPGLPRRRRILVSVVGGAIVVTAVLWIGLFRRPRSSSSEPGSGSAVGKSIAVLPFENLSGDPNNAYFSSGVQDEILTRLAKIHALKVISRTSTLKYASRPENLKTVGAELGVASVLEGSVQHAGDRVRVNVQLINAGDDAHLWAETYDSDMKDIFSAETDIATKVADALKAELLPQESAGISRIPTQDPAAYDLFLKAEYQFDSVINERGSDPEAEVSRAVALYSEALQHDPAFVLALAHRSRVLSQAYWFAFGGRSSSQIVQARADARRALALGPNVPESHLAMGYVDYFGDRNYVAALVEFHQAAKDLPNDPNVIAAIAYIGRRQGKFAEAIPALVRAAAIDPRNPSFPLEIGNTYAHLGKYSQAVAAYDKVLEISPYNWEAVANRILMKVMADRISEAESELASVPAGADPQGTISLVTYELARLRRDPEAMLKAFAAAPTWVVRRWTHGAIPSALLRGDAYTMKHDQVRAEAAYEEAARLLEDARKRSPEDSAIWRDLSQLEAARGKKTEALEDAKRALELLPASKDALVGPSNLYNLAAIKARTGDIPGALADLRELLGMPHGTAVSIPILRLDPDWDFARSDPRFQALLKGS